MNTNIRNIGGALGSAIATSIVVSHLLPSGCPARRVHGLAFVCSASLVVAALAALTIPTRALSPGRSQRVASGRCRGGRGVRRLHRLRAEERPG